MPDEELLTAGLASTATTGRLIDRFRDRLVLPVIHRDDILGCTARRHPHSGDQTGAPKCLNTPDTPLFHKGAQLYVWLTDRFDAGAVPVLVEGALDAIAITTATHGRYVGVAPIGTALTDEHVHQLGALGRTVVLGTDNDPAQVLAERGAPALHQAIDQARQAGEVFAARSSSTWTVRSVLHGSVPDDPTGPDSRRRAAARRTQSPTQRPAAGMSRP